MDQPWDEFRYSIPTGEVLTVYDVVPLAFGTSAQSDGLLTNVHRRIPFDWKRFWSLNESGN